MVDRRALELLIGLGQGYRTGLRGIAQVPDDASTDNRREVHFLCQAAAMFFIGQEIAHSIGFSGRQLGLVS
jgi:hypothetical protein